MADRSTWRASLWLWDDQRDALDELATEIKRATGYRPTASEIIRALVDAGLGNLKGERWRELAGLLEDKAPRAAAPVAEEWIRERLTLQAKRRKS